MLTGRPIHSSLISLKRTLEAGTALHRMREPASTPPEPKPDDISVLGVKYVRYGTACGGDLYLTSFGYPFHEQLTPENWYSPNWFNAHGRRLQGSSPIYYVPTRPVRGVSLSLVVRFNRVGEEVPLDERTVCEYPHAEFNSPFEEFSLVMALREPRPDLPNTRVLTKRPLAIFVPAKRLRLWQTGRRKWVFSAKQALHPEAPIDILRQYVTLYGWIKGLDAVQAAEALGLTGADRDRFLDGVTRRAFDDLSLRGLRVLDLKPRHIIVRIRSDGALLRGRDGKPSYALIDYELLERVRMES